MTPATGGETSGTYVDLPADPTLWKTTGLPLTRVKLPLEGRIQSHPLWFLFYSLLGLFGPTMLVVTGFSVASGRDDALTSLMGFLVSLPLLVLSANTLGYYRDLLRPRPVLLIDEQGLWDVRSSDHRLWWKDIAGAKALQNKRSFYSVHLHLRLPFAARRRARSLATTPYIVRRSDRDLIVSLEFLDDTRVLALAILELVERHGGVVEGR